MTASTTLSSLSAKLSPPPPRSGMADVKRRGNEQCHAAVDSTNCDSTAGPIVTDAQIFE